MYEYRWMGASHDSARAINDLAKLGWRVVPGILLHDPNGWPFVLLELESPSSPALPPEWPSADPGQSRGSPQPPTGQEGA
jgi:hypothetical protein